jgi:hypothetical protein
MKQAWNLAPHGSAIINADSGQRFDKWIGDKPDMAPSFDRFIESNVLQINSDDLVSDKWEIE